jgi:hypothetical protein
MIKSIVACGLISSISFFDEFKMFVLFISNINKMGNGFSVLIAFSDLFILTVTTYKKEIIRIQTIH